jgi:hypothetical protein
MSCWDFWSYTDDGCGTRRGLQMRAIKAIEDRLLGQ